MTHEIAKEYNDFMKWFELNHPEDFEKYGRNIDVPFEIGGGVTVNNKWKISNEEQERILKLAHIYYQQKQG